MPLDFNPPLLNSANPWATTKEDIQALYDSPYTGAVTIRTSVFGGFPHDDGVHQWRFLGDGKFACFLLLLHFFLGSNCHKHVMVISNSWTVP